MLNEILCKTINIATTSHSCSWTAGRSLCRFSIWKTSSTLSRYLMTTSDEALDSGCDVQLADTPKRGLYSSVNTTIITQERGEHVSYGGTSLSKLMNQSLIFQLRTFWPLTIVTPLRCKALIFCFCSRDFISAICIYTCALQRTARTADHKICVESGSIQREILPCIMHAMVTWRPAAAQGKISTN